MLAFTLIASSIYIVLIISSTIYLINNKHRDYYTLVDIIESVVASALFGWFFMIYLGLEGIKFKKKKQTCHNTEKNQ